MKYRKLRIAWSIWWGLLALLLIVLWVRSYWWTDRLLGPVFTSRYCQINSCCGMFSIATDVAKYGNWTLSSDPLSTKERQSEIEEGRKARFRFRQIGAKYYDVQFPDWPLVAAATALAAGPWIRWSRRFSLRTLLIAMTLIALVLSMIVWLSRC